MDGESLESATNRAADFLQDERSRTAVSYRACRDPATKTTEMEDSDIACLKRKYPFLAEFSDAFIRSTGPAELKKMESTSINPLVTKRSLNCVFFG